MNLKQRIEAINKLGKVRKVYFYWSEDYLDLIKKSFGKFSAKNEFFNITNVDFCGADLKVLRGMLSNLLPSNANEMKLAKEFREQLNRYGLVSLTKNIYDPKKIELEKIVSSHNCKIAKMKVKLEEAKQALAEYNKSMEGK